MARTRDGGWRILIPLYFFFAVTATVFLLSMTRCFSLATALDLPCFCFWFLFLDFGDLSPMIELVLCFG